MYFSLEPKRLRADLYNREKELNQLEKAIRRGRIVTLTGIRRIGKTSVLQVFLEERKTQGDVYVFLDCRSFVKNFRINKTEFDFRFTEELEKVIQNKPLKIVLESITKVSIKDWLHISFRNSHLEKVDVFQKLDDVDKALGKIGKKLIIAFDEAQNLRFYGSGGYTMLNLFAHAYDFLKNIVFVITGSEVGILYDFLKLDDIKSPLYGRYIDEIRLERFTENESISFLTKGFDQVGIELNKEEIKKAVNTLDGLVGYLVIYGYMVLQKKDYKDALEDSLKMARDLISSEIEELTKRSLNYKYVLKAVAFGMENFSEIKEYINLHYGGISDQSLSNILTLLVKQCFLEYKFRNGSKIYEMPDPILKQFVLSLRD